MVYDWSGGAVLRFSGKTRGTDFVQFYVAGRQANAGTLTADWQKQYADQLLLVPTSAGCVHPPLYPPQVAAAFGPLARLSYLPALLVWLALSTVGFVLSALALRRWLFPDCERTLFWLAVAAFPPFWVVIQYGQLSTAALVAFTLAVVALGRDHRFAAGLALGVLVYKPTLHPGHFMTTSREFREKELRKALETAGMPASEIDRVIAGARMNPGI